MPAIHTRPMTSIEFDAMRSGLITDYAAEHVRAGTWSQEEAEQRASDQTNELLPQGVETPGVLLLMAETPEGEPVGYLWLALERTPGSGDGAWIYDIEILEAQRGKGYGRALLEVADDEAVKHHVDSIGLNVFGPNRIARGLYESSGYEITSVLMRKELKIGRGSPDDPTV
jgi:ribosomal protein S18 acetylase RimI-like enzyme